MGLPAKRRTKQSKRERASHFALVKANLTTCSHCKRKILPHRVCPYCGYYRGREVLKLETILGKKAQRRAEEKKAKTPEHRH
ncbi:MAG: 50S ribosomal protein L32 [Candidatus Kerfeldbacteria bacterium]|nr:50S ribosomal protein L32 [Candidatus Kerfeldbacteria bacterium]